MAVKAITGTVVTIAAAGTAQQASTTAIPISSITFQAESGNTGNTFIGDSTVDSTDGLVLEPGLDITFTVVDSQTDEFILSDFWIDAATNGDKVRFSYIKRR